MYVHSYGKGRTCLRTCHRMHVIIFCILVRVAFLLGVRSCVYECFSRVHFVRLLVLECVRACLCARVVRLRACVRMLLLERACVS